MTCDEFKALVPVHLAEGSEGPGDHGGSCSECARWADLARAAWELAGRSPDEAVPASVAEAFHLSCRRPRRADLTLLRPGPLAAAAVLVLGVVALLWPAKAERVERPMYWSDGMLVERYELPAGVDAERVAEEIRRDVAPEEDWREGASAVEAGKGFLRVRGTGEVQKAVREFLRTRR